MNDNLKQFKHLKDVALPPEEKERLRVFLHEYMALKPRRVVAPKQEKSWSWLVLLGGAGYRALAALIALSISGGVVLASEGSLPGDTLYPVKTSINENVREALTTSPAAQARLQSKLLDRRVAEAEELSQEDRLTPQAKEVLETNIAEHVAKAQRQLAKLEASSEPLPDDLLEVKGTILAHGQLLAYGGLDGQPTDGTAVNDEVHLFAAGLRVATASSTVATSASSSEMATLMAPADEAAEDPFTSDDPVPVATYNRLQRAQSIIAASQALYDSHQPNFDNITRFDLNRHLRDAQKYWQDGSDHFFAGDFLAAERSSRQAVVAAQEAKTLISIKVALLKRAAEPAPIGTATTTATTTEDVSTSTTTTDVLPKGDQAKPQTDSEVNIGVGSGLDPAVSPSKGDSAAEKPSVKDDLIKGLESL